MVQFEDALSEKLAVILAQVDCVICRDIFSNPITLVCGDSFCKECINAWKANINCRKNQGDGDVGKFVCPSCRIELGPRSSMPENVPLRKLSEIARMITTKWENLFGRQYEAPKVQVPLSQSTTAEMSRVVGMSKPGSIASQLPATNAVSKRPDINRNLEPISENCNSVYNVLDQNNMISEDSDEDHVSISEVKGTCKVVEKPVQRKGTKKKVLENALRSQNPVIQHMRDIVKAGERIGLGIENDARTIETPTNKSDISMSSAVKRPLSNLNESGGSVKKKSRKVPSVTSEFGQEDPEIFDIGMTSEIMEDSSSRDSELDHIRQDSDFISKKTDSLSLARNLCSTGDRGKNPIESCPTGISEIPLTLAESDLGQKKYIAIDSTNKMDASTETPVVSAYFFIYPDGRTVVTGVRKYLVNSSVQTEDTFGLFSKVEFTEKIQVVDSSVQATPEILESSVQATPKCSESSVQSIPTISEKQCQAKALSSDSECQTDRRLISPLEIPNNLNLASGEGEHLEVTCLKAQDPKLEYPKMTALCPDSLATTVALCQADVDEEEDILADTISAQSNLSESTRCSNIGDIVPPSPNAATSSGNNHKGADFIPSSVQSFLKSQDPKFADAHVLSVLEKDVPATVVTPKHAEVSVSDSKLSLSNFSERLSNQFGQGGNIQSSTPSGTSLRKVALSPILQQIQSDLPQLLKECRAEPSTMSLTCSGCSGQETYVLALRKFGELFKCIQTGSFVVRTTTHIVVRTIPGYPRNHRVCDRTMKYLFGVAARRWVVSIQWVLDSVREGRVLPEEEYEITGDACTAPDHYGPAKSRCSRVGLFNNIEICCPDNSISNPCFTREDIFKLIELCGGMRIDSPDAFSYKRGTKRVILFEESVDETGQARLPTPEEIKRRKDTHRRYKAVLLSVDWVLDSISRSVRIDASLPINAAYSLFPVPVSELAALAST